MGQKDWKRSPEKIVKDPKSIQGLVCGRGIALDGYTCLRFGSDEFLDVDGGNDRACRGATEADNDPSHYTISTVGSRAECKQACRDNLACVGIEHAGTRSLAALALIMDFS